MDVLKIWILIMLVFLLGLIWMGIGKLGILGVGLGGRLGILGFRGIMIVGLLIGR